MTLAPIDWIIVAVYMTGCISAGVWMRRYVRGVDDFAVAGRQMDVHLGVASLAATEVGIVTLMYTAQLGFTNGLAGAIPGVLIAASMYVVGLTGFVIVPMRDAGVMTIPELFEKRFGTRVRWLAGLVVIVGGLLNMGIFLRVGGEFLMYVTGFDATRQFTLSLLGHTLQIGYLEVMMTSLLAVILLYTALGGMLSVLITDYLQFLVLGLGIVIISILVVVNVGWSNLLSSLWQAHESGAKVVEVSAAAGQASVELKMKDPFNPFTSLGWTWVLWQALTAVAIVTTWQTTIARVLAARDSQAAKSVYRRSCFFFVGRFVLPGLWGAAAFLYFAAQPDGLPAGVDSLKAMPVYLSKILPVGIIGIVIAAMLAAEMSTDAGYLLTWATVIYNDLINPCLSRPMSSKAKLLTVRLVVLGIGVFLVFYGLWYQLPGGAWEYLAITGNIYLASLFTLLVAALYWKGANSWGAVAAIVLGAVVPLAYLVINPLIDRFGLSPDWKISADASGFAAFALAFGGMVIGSMLARALGLDQTARTSQIGEIK
ncbi:MAG: sodium:solute symporter family protein [Thermoguttaceae bacterium]|jgi:SSS family solute:Na+ symporter